MPYASKTFALFILFIFNVRQFRIYTVFFCMVFNMLLCRLHQFLSSVSFARTNNCGMTIRTIFRFVIHQLRQVNRVSNRVAYQFYNVSRRVYYFICLCAIRFRYANVLIRLIATEGWGTAYDGCCHGRTSVLFFRGKFFFGFGVCVVIRCQRV